MPPSPGCSRPCGRRCSSSRIPSSRTVGWDLRNSQILHLVKAYKEDRYKSRAGSRSQEPFFGKRDLEFFRLVEKGQVYDFYFARAQLECPDYLAAKIRRTKQKAAWAELWKRYLEEIPAGRATEGHASSSRRIAASSSGNVPSGASPSMSTSPPVTTSSRSLFADVFYGRAVVDTPISRLFESTTRKSYNGSGSRRRTTMPTLPAGCSGRKAA